MLLTIDIGTSNFKSALWELDGNQRAFSRVPLNIIKSDNAIHETDPLQWLSAFDASVKEISSLYKNVLHDIKAVIISGNGPSLVPVLGEPEFSEKKVVIPCGRARLWLDTRAVKYQDEVSRLMGGYVDASFFLPKILYIKNEENIIYKNTKHFLGCPEYLAYALTGEAKSVFPCDGFERWFWNEAVLEKLNFEAEKFPAFVRPGELFGMLSKKASDAFGFKENIPVISGGPDFFAAILGSGVNKSGQVCDRTGSSEGINLCTEFFVNDKRLMCYGHPVKPYWNLSGIINTTGKAIEWGCDLLGISNIDDFFSLVKKSAPGSGGLIFNPYLSGERSPLWNSSARAKWSGIGLYSNRNDFANSILEGTAFAIKDVISVMNESGAEAKQLHVTGGLAGYDVLNKIKADITGLPVMEGNYKKAELLGLAIIGACFLGIYKNYEDACASMCRVFKTYEPDLKNTGIYQDLFEKYRAGSV